MSKEKKYTTSELSEMVTKEIQQLAKATDKARRSEKMQKYLNFCARFHNYSTRNIWLIMSRKPDATIVAGFWKWKSMGRYVKKGEKGIPIFAPMIKKVEVEGEDENQEKLVGFKVVYVFDVSQTEGDPLPEQPEWKSQHKDEELSQRLIQFAESQGIEVLEECLDGDSQGESHGGKIIVDPEAGTSTIIHELAHELMHYEPHTPSNKKVLEMEAESVAYVVGKHLGLKDLECPNYNALFGIRSKHILERLKRIRVISTKIITGMNNWIGLDSDHK